MTEQDERGDQLHAAAAQEVAVTPPAVPSMTAWGRRAALIYLGLGALALAGMAVETVLGHPGTLSMFAAFLAVPWSMLVAGFAPPLPANLPMALGLAARMAPLALFMLLNAAIVAGIAARSERDLTGRGAKALLLVLLAGALSSSCALTSKQEVFTAAPTGTLYFLNGGRLTTILQFDLSAVPAWNGHRGHIKDVTDVSLMGEYSNPSGGPIIPASPTDVEIAAVPGLASLVTGSEPVVWGSIHLEPGAIRRVDWNEGMTRTKPAAAMLRRELSGDGRLTLLVRSILPPGGLGGVTVGDFRLGAVLQVR